MTDLDTVMKFASGIGATTVLVLMVYGLLKGWFVTGREHGVLVSLYKSVQVDMTSMRNELKSLRDRDAIQQQEIDGLRQLYAAEKQLKESALEIVEQLRSRIADLERQVASYAKP